MKQNYKSTLIVATAIFIMLSCKKKPINKSDFPIDKDTTTINQDTTNNEDDTSFGVERILANFEDDGLAPAFYTSNKAMVYTILNNPYKSGINPSAKCGQITSLETSNNEKVYTETLDGTFRFTKANSRISFKIASAVAAQSVTFSVEVENTDKPNQAKIKKTITQNIIANSWDSVVFNFNVGVDVYNKINIYFEEGRKELPNTIWYFDDLLVPEMKFPVTLFERVSPGVNSQLGLFLAKSKIKKNWYKDHIAGASILKPTETKDGKWRMYLRGSSDSYSTIGMFEQASATFTNPTVVGVGGWKENSSSAYPNPVVNYGSYAWEAATVANPVTVVDDQKNLYLYYVGKADDDGDNGGTKSIGVATSTDANGLVFTKRDALKLGPLQNGHGVTTSVLYKNGTFYHFNHGGGAGAEGSQIWLGTNTSPYVLTDPTLVIAQGTTYDTRSIQAGRVFSVPNDANPNRRYMVYSCSSTKGDYPDRFHCAYSDNWTTWTKVVNDKPFFLRGLLGNWDQGAVWSCDVLEYNGDLYMYYEGWGRQGTMTDRNTAYSGPGGASQVGVAKVSISSFMNWVAGN